ncbi:Hypothetical predicted protein [Pelobates cultripes]|uniref:Endonuclease/exonuclease/phosphatase domain-containing protein n=1 Tax=Pelobates cultripes TaxID=61616 RepID=A0AAD1SBB0_PELCU|nr:Hypothetical predicted protein [Pelobates cultripes]
MPLTRRTPCFWESFCAHVASLATKHIIVGGDVNATQSPATDCKTYPDKTPTTTRNDKLYANFLKDTALIDVWRAHHPSVKNYTFYSHTHRSYSRIDSFLTLQTIQPCTVQTSIGNIVWSDHAEVALTIQIPRLSREWRWHLNLWILRDKPTIYTENVAPATVWAAHRAVIRGKLIAIASSQKQQRLKNLTTALAELTRLETLHKQAPSDQLLAHITATRERITQLSKTDVAKNLMWTKQRFYEKGNKADSLLAHYIKDTDPNWRNYARSGTNSCGISVLLH